jgi:DNA repair exonuclease SbcCD ATPase subunit
MEFEYHNRKPQDDVPVDLIIHYIVKDYQRMYLTYDEMEKRALKAEATIEELKEKHLKDLEGKNRVIKNMKMNIESKEHVEQMKEKLDTARQQNLVLANAIVALNKGNGTLTSFQGLGISIDAKDLEKKVSTQLGDALIKLTAVEERLSNCQQLLENCNEINKDAIQIKTLLTKIAKAFGQIDSASKHIENFYKLANGTPLT